jgi:hypothetical protein
MNVNQNKLYFLFLVQPNQVVRLLPNLHVPCGSQAY